jgi:galactonate dehydratase
METKKIAAIAEAYNTLIAPHVCASPIVTAAALQLDACISNFMIQEVYPYRPREHFQLVDYASEEDIKNGLMCIPDRPGLGISSASDRVRPFRWAKIES